MYISSGIPEDSHVFPLLETLKLYHISTRQLFKLKLLPVYNPEQGLALALSDFYSLNYD